LPLRTPEHNRRGGRGFTLLELLVVMVILAIAFFAVRPNFVRSLQANRDRAAVRRVVGVLTSARTQAVARGRLVRVFLDLGRRRLWGEIQAEPEGDRALFDPLPLLGRAETKLPDYLAVSDLVVGGESAARRTERIIYFFPDGRTTGASMTLLGEAGGEFPLGLSPVTGRVYLEE
jgi:general secretion pathway protein H